MGKRKYPGKPISYLQLVKSVRMVMPPPTKRHGPGKYGKRERRRSKKITRQSRELED